MLVNQFDLYDILSVIIPGGLLVTAALYLQPFIGLSHLTSPAALIGLTILAYALGHLIQAFSEWREYKLTNFENRIDPVIDNSNPKELDKKFWELAKDRFDLSKDFENAGEVLTLVLSELDASKMVRANKMQALYAFHRNMWGTAQVFTVIFLAATVLELSKCAIDPMFLVNTGVLCLSALSIVLFERRKEQFSGHFIRYTISDFYALHTED